MRTAKPSPGRTLAWPAPARLSWMAFLAGIASLPVASPVTLACWLVALAALVRSGVGHRLGPAGRYLAATALVLVAVVPFSVRPGDSLLGLFNYWPFFLFFGLAARLVDSPGRLRRVLQVVLVGALVTGGVGLVEWASGSNWQWEPVKGLVLLVIGSRQEAGILDRVTAFFAWPTSAAAYFLLVLPVALSTALGGEARLRPLAWAAFGAVGIALVGTASRNAWIIALLASVALLVVARRLVPVLSLAAAAAAVAVAGLGPTEWSVVELLRRVVPAALWQKVAESVTSGTASFESLINRFDAWQIAFEMTRRRPWTGWGLQTFPFVESEIFGRDAANLLHAHNLYLTYSAETGLPAALLLVGFYLWTLCVGVQRAVMLKGVARWQLAGLVAALASYLLFGLSDVPFYDARINGLFWLWSGLIWSFPAGGAAQRTIEAKPS
ncbi:O-antigen ligase family protein [Gloeobacter violaceus]|uniref:O-antigen ligase family protein n=1 Tax=Gloeobacter violaceus TaxID=33072 RepID=UPI0002D82695|nr:O-antigen ligase family protein [Gloeobacter violaceus]